MEESKKVARFGMRCRPEWLEMLDQWRGDRMSRTEAIEVLVAQGLQSTSSAEQDIRPCTTN